MPSRAFGATSGSRSAPLSGPMERYRIPILDHFQTTRGPGLAAITGESGPESAREINAVVISPRET